MIGEQGQQLVDSINGLFTINPVSHSDAVSVLVFALANVLYDGTMEEELSAELESDLLNLLKAAYTFIATNDQPVH